MPKPQKSQAIIELKAVVVSPEDAAGEGHKLSLIVTAHQLWLSAGRGLEVADIQSVKLTEPTTVAVRMIGRPKPYEIHCRSEDEARQLRACLVFQAKYTRGGIPGVEDWRQLLDKAYDTVDISATAMPSGAALSRTGYMPIPGKPGQAGQASSGRKKLVLIGLLALVLVAIAVTVISLVNRGPSAAENATNLGKLVQLGNEALDRRDFKLALSQYQQALPLSPKSPELNARIGECLMAENNFGEATSYLQKAVFNDDWRHPEYSIQLAHSYNMAGQPDKALAFLTSKTKGNLPADVGINYELAYAFDKRGKTSEALSAIEKAYREHPERADVTQLYTALLVKATRLRDAAAVCLAVARRQRTADAYMKAIAATGKTGDIKAAETLIAEARSVLPNDMSLKRNPSDILAGLGVSLPKPPPPPPPPVPVTNEVATPPLLPGPVTSESATTAAPPTMVPSTVESAMPPTTSTVPAPPETAITPGVGPPESAVPATSESATPPATTEIPAPPANP